MKLNSYPPTNKTKTPYWKNLLPDCQWRCQKARTCWRYKSGFLRMVWNLQRAVLHLEWELVLKLFRNSCLDLPKGAEWMMRGAHTPSLGSKQNPLEDPGGFSLRGIFEDQPLENFVHLLCTSCWWSNFSGFRNPRNKHKRQLQVQNNQTKWQPSLGWSSFQGFFSTKRQGLVGLPAIEGTSWPQWFSGDEKILTRTLSKREAQAYPQTHPPSKSVDFFGIRYNMIIFEELSDFKHLIP